MPFQVVFSVFQIPPGIITGFTAGDDEFSICNTTVTVTATVTGDISGHLFEWEQVGGDTVTWLTPITFDANDGVLVAPDTFEFSATYEYLGAIRDDKTFRFYIDKGTPVVQSDDVVIVSTPTSTFTPGLSTPAIALSPLKGVNFSHVGDACRKVEKQDVRLFPAFPLTPHSGDFAQDPSSHFLVIQLPCTIFDIERIISFNVEENCSGNWNVIFSSMDYNNRALTTLTPGCSYRYVFFYDDASFQQEYITSFTTPSKYAQPSKPGGYASSSVTVGLEKSKTVLQDYSVLQRSLITCPISTDQNTNLVQAGLEQHINLFDYSVLQRSLITCPISTDQNTNLVQAGLEQHINIFNYSVIDLTGGGIGG